MNKCVCSVVIPVVMFEYCVGKVLLKSCATFILLLLKSFKLFYRALKTWLVASLMLAVIIACLLSRSLG